MSRVKITLQSKHDGFRMASLRKIARDYAARVPSDPFAYGRVLSEMANGNCAEGLPDEIQSKIVKEKISKHIDEVKNSA